MSLEDCLHSSAGRKTATGQPAVAFPQVAAVIVATSLFWIPSPAASGPSCARFALHELLPGMSHEMGALLLRDLRALTAGLESLGAPLPGERKQVSAFAH